MHLVMILKRKKRQTVKLGDKLVKQLRCVRDVRRSLKGSLTPSSTGLSLNNIYRPVISIAVALSLGQEAKVYPSLTEIKADSDK